MLPLSLFTVKRDSIIRHKQTAHTRKDLTTVPEYYVVVLVVVTFFNHNFVNCKATLIWRLKIYEIKYNISLKG